jgi:HAD superfamily hydrolase (TIGR01490 family)
VLKVVKRAKYIYMEEKTAAFFDLDNTLIKGAALFHLGKGLIKYKELKKSEIRVFARAQLKFRTTSKEPRLNSLADKALTLLAGREVKKIEELTIKIVDEFMPYSVHAGAIELLNSAKLQYDEVWILSAAPDQLVKIIAERLKINGGIGTKLLTKDGLYTGALEGKFHHGEAKATSVKKLATDRNINLIKSAAYSDSYNDLPLLLSCGLPNAVNPDRRLRKYSRKRFWPIRDLSNRYKLLYSIGFIVYSILTLFLVIKIF